MTTLWAAATHPALSHWQVSGNTNTYHILTKARGRGRPGIKSQCELSKSSNKTQMTWHSKPSCKPCGTPAQKPRPPRTRTPRDTAGQHCLVFKVHLTPKYFFHSNKSLHLFKTHCAFLPLFNPNLDFLQAVMFTCMQISLWCQPRNRSIPLTCSVVQQMMARFRNFYSLWKVKIWVKKGHKAQCVSNRCKDLFERKKYFGVRCT